MLPSLAFPSPPGFPISIPIEEVQHAAFAQPSALSVLPLASTTLLADVTGALAVLGATGCVANARLYGRSLLSHYRIVYYCNARDVLITGNNHPLSPVSKGEPPKRTHQAQRVLMRQPVKDVNGLLDLAR